MERLEEGHLRPIKGLSFQLNAVFEQPIVMEILDIFRFVCDLSFPIGPKGAHRFMGQRRQMQRGPAILLRHPYNLPYRKTPRLMFEKRSSNHQKKGYQVVATVLPFSFPDMSRWLFQTSLAAIASRPSEEVFARMKVRVSCKRSILPKVPQGSSLV